MVEPVDYVFERLVTNYGDCPDLAFERCAIGAQSGEMPFYYLRQDESMPPWYDQLGSLDKETLLGKREIVPDIEERLRTSMVPCLTFPELINKHGMARLDLLHTDTEGADAEILHSLDFDFVRPTVILFENAYMTPSTKKALYDHLSGHHYLVIEVGLDTLALSRPALGALPLLRGWLKLQPSAARYGPALT